MGVMAGPIEFSTGEVVLLVAAVAAVFLLPPAIGAFIGYQNYRRRTPVGNQTTRGAWLAAALGAVVAVVVLVVGGGLTQLVSVLLN